MTVSFSSLFARAITITILLNPESGFFQTGLAVLFACLFAAYVVFHPGILPDLTEEEGRVTGLPPLDRLAEFSCHHKAGIVLGGVTAVFILSLVLIFSPGFLGGTSRRESAGGVWFELVYFLSCCLLIAVVLFGMLYSDHSKKDILTCYGILDWLEDSGIEGVVPVKRRYLTAMNVPGIKANNEREERERRYYQKCRTLFVIAWVLLSFGLALFCVDALDLPFIPGTWLRFLVFSALMVNCHFFYSCCVLVWMLRELSNVDGIDQIERIHQKPELAPFYQKLLSITSINTVVFLMISMVLSITGFASVLFSTDGYPIALLTWLLLANFVGVTGFFVMFVGSKVFLRKILHAWRRAECQRAAKRQQSVVVDPIELYAPDPMSMADKLSIAIATLDVVASVAVTVMTLTIGA